MKGIKKIGLVLAILILNFYNTCFADLVVEEPESGTIGGGGTVNQTVSETSLVKYVLIGIIIFIVVAGVIFIIREITKKKNEKGNDNF